MMPVNPILDPLSTERFLRTAPLQEKEVALRSFFGPQGQCEMNLDLARWFSNLVSLVGIPCEIGFTLPDLIMKRVRVVLGEAHFVSSSREIVEHNHPIHPNPVAHEGECIYMMGLPSPGDFRSIITRGQKDQKTRIRRTLFPFSGALYRFDPRQRGLAILYGINPDPDTGLLSHLGCPFGSEETSHPIRLQRLEEALAQLQRQAEAQGLTCLAREIPFDDVVHRHID